ncbi:MAG: hypothetical protein RSE24_03795, partial [Oscillospiraceae bacterium]
PSQGRVLFVSTELKPLLSQALVRQWGNQENINTSIAGYNDMTIVYVPKTRFCTAITLNDGSATWGYSKAAGAADINFMIIHNQAILQAKKFALPKVFTPDENQINDSWKFQFRLYHDCFVYDNKKNGIFVHKAIN